MFDSFNKIKIYIYDNDHNPPHFHAIHGNDSVVIEIATLEVMAGGLPPALLKKVIKWARNNQVDLKHEFERVNP